VKYAHAQKITRVAVFEYETVDCDPQALYLLSLNVTMTTSDQCSYEPKRATAYSEDLRWRMVWQREGLGMKCTDVAVNLGVDHTTVSRTVSLFRSTGGVQKKSYPRDKAFTVLSPALESTIVHLVLVLMRPGIYLREIQTELADQTGVDLSLTGTTIWRFLHRTGFTRQRL